MGRDFDITQCPNYFCCHRNSYPRVLSGGRGLDFVKFPRVFPTPSLTQGISIDRYINRQSGSCTAKAMHFAMVAAEYYNKAVYL